MAYSWFRRPRHIGVKRALCALGCLRGSKVPPDDWDDIAYSRQRDRSWKNKRRTQYHVRVPS